MAEADNSGANFLETMSDSIQNSGSAQDGTSGFTADGDNDTVTGTESRSWFQKLMDAIVGVLIGLALVVGTCAGLFWNEGRAVQTARSLAEGGGLVVGVDSGRIDPANEGKLVHVQGDLRTTAPVSDPDLLVKVQAARLVRLVEMYQWKEESRTETHKKLGGGEERVTTYSYTRVWADRRNDSSRFHRPGGHENPRMRYERFEAEAQDATLGGWRPGPEALRRLPARETLRVEPAAAETLKPRFGNAVHAIDGKLYLGNDPAQPRIGDLRVTYQIAPVGPASFIGRQAGTDIAEYQTKAGDKLLMAATGLVPAAAMFKQAEDENRMITWLLRAVFAVFLWLGWYLIIRPIAVVGDVVPFIGSILDAGAGLVALVFTMVFAPLVIAIAWLWYRPLVSIAVIVAGGAVAYGLRELAKRRAAAGPAARAPSLPGGAPAAPA